MIRAFLFATATQALDASQRQRGYHGRTVILGQVVDVVDMRELARSCGITIPNGADDGGGP